MRYRVFVILALCSCILAPASFGQGNKKLMVHYMPWYASKDVSGGWGWHWTMGFFDPDTILPSGQREIASQHYPSIGPYDSSDPDALEYHVLLMKLAGIDGVVVDWYGSSSWVDYGELRDNTEELFEFTKRAGLLFSVCYEDRTIEALVQRGHIPSSGAVAQAQQDMTYLESTYLNHPSYFTIDNKHVILNFGPHYIKQGSQWASIFSVLQEYPLFITLNDRKYSSAGAFAWPPMHGYNVSQSKLNSYLNQFENKAAGWAYSVSGAFPRFHDIYEEAGLHDSYGYLSGQGGQTFEDTLERGILNDSDFVQLITWNDFGEGTIIEPTDEFGFESLVTIQDMRRTHLEPAFPHTIDVLDIPERMYNLRKSEEGNSSVQAELDLLFDDIVAGNMAAARSRIETLDPDGGPQTPQEEGTKLHLYDNTWKAIPLSYDVTPNTVLEFDFISDGNEDAEINAIGLDTQRLLPTDSKLFQIYGSQTISSMIHDQAYNTPGSTQHITLPVGQYYTGQMSYLVFVNDNDGHADASVRFSNVQVHEMSP